MNKSTIVSQLKQKLEKELSESLAASASTKGLSSSDDLKSEGKYDTRAIEAGYLASAQMRRVEELKGELALLDEMIIDLPNEHICVGHLVTLEFNSKIQYYFISSTSGGTILQVEGSPILVISAFSPLGRELAHQNKLLRSKHLLETGPI
jgi:hypothetical protein